MAEPFYITASNVQGFQFLHILVSSCYFTFLTNYGYPSGFEVVPRCGFDLHFPNANEFGCLFMCFLTICISSLKNVFSNPLPVFNWVVCFLWLSCKCSLYILNARPLLDI